MQDQTARATPERISELASRLLVQIRETIKSIGDINLQSRVLSINAQIEAARAGEAGRSFSVVGQEMVAFSDRIQQAAKLLERESQSLVLELVEISRILATNVQGTRLADLAYTNIDLVDRNLYERTCDCRWWATDAAMVSALENTADTAAIDFASMRLGVILKAYTVYSDIVLADLSGKVVANGRPREFSSIGTQHQKAPWFTTAMASASGDHFGFQTAHLSALGGNRAVLIYSCKVCKGGDANAPALGVIGVIFKWDEFSQRIIQETPIEPEKKETTRVCIVDKTGHILADSANRMLVDRLDLSAVSSLLPKKRGSEVVLINGRDHLVAHAQSPGFETYRTDWHSFIMETLA